MWSIIGTAVAGRTSLVAEEVWPGETVSRLVPSASIVASRFAWLEAETPTTATIAPIPIAIPSADSAARSSPGPQTLQRDAEQLARRQAGRCRSGRVCGSAADGRVVMRARPRRSRRRASAAAGEMTPRCSASWVISTSVAPSEASSCSSVDDLAAGPRVEVAGRLVGEDDQRPLGDRARDRDPLALASGELRRAVGEPVAEPDALERRAAPPARRSRRRTPVYSIPVATLSSAVIDVLEVERPGRRSRSGGRAAPRARGPRPSPTSRPATRTSPLVGRSSVPRIVSIVVLPDPDGPTTAT